MNNKLIMGTDLKVIGGFELTITHMIFLHAHERRISIGL